MKLSEWAKEKGISYRTAHRMFKAGTLPVEYEQLPTGTILVYPDKVSVSQVKAVLYARVSSHDQKADLKRQMNRLKDFTAAKGLKVVKEVSEIGSSLNGKRSINKILSDPKVSVIVVEHRDRLARFGVEMLASALSASGRKIMVMNETEYKDDLIQDFVDLVTSMCARIYGRRSARNRAKKALKAIEEA
ncbi:putative resolvase [Candidatus Magnetomoraceae bacterium gMMP-1]